MNLDQSKTEAVNKCFSCRALLTAADRFCRTCGASQHPTAFIDTGNRYPAARTTMIVRNPVEQKSTSQTLSNVLVNTLTESVATKTMSLGCGRFGNHLIGGLVVIPIWLLIILLSPLDAYAAARAASSQVNCE